METNKQMVFQVITKEETDDVGIILQSIIPVKELHKYTFGQLIEYTI